MADAVASPGPQCKQKVEASGSSAGALKGNWGYTVSKWDSDDEMDWEQEQEYFRQIRESDGFDVESFPLPDGGIMPRMCLGTSEDPIDVTLYGRLGLHCYNIQKGTNLQLKHLEKYNVEFISFSSYYITLEATDPTSGSLYTFQTCVTDSQCGNKEQLRTETEICRLKPTTPGFEVSGQWDDWAVDGFYKGDMPNWNSDDASTTVGKLQHCCEVPVQDLDSGGIDDLRLYCELALYYKLEIGKCSCEAYKSFMPLEMKQVYVQTRDKVKPVWKAKNAIFYVSFSPCGFVVEYKAIVRKTMDGQLGNLRLETKLLSI